jgi:hypothetical protein
MKVNSEVGPLMVAPDGGAGSAVTDPPAETQTPEADPPADAPPDQADADPVERGGLEALRDSINETDGDDGDGGKPNADSVAPEAYEAFTVPEDMVLNEVQLGEFQAVAKELNLTQEQAQKFVDLQVAEVGRSEVRAAEHWADVTRGWTKELRNHPTLGGTNYEPNVKTFLSFVDRQAKDGMKEFLNQGYAQMPEVFEFIVDIANKTKEDTFGGAGATNEGGADAQLRQRYPSMFKKE